MAARSRPPACWVWPVNGLDSYTIQHIYRKEKNGTFPKRVRIGPNRVGWVESEVAAWVQQRIAER